MRYLLLIPLLLFLAACDDEDALVSLDDAPTPTDLSLAVEVADDNTGLVTLTPGGRGVTSFTIDLNDGTTEPITGIQPGESIDLTLQGRTYDVILTALGINGSTATMTRQVDVSFRPAENLAVTVSPVAGDPFSVEVTATADFEDDFLVYFGETADEEPTVFAEGETVSYTYATVGSYDIRVAARNGSGVLVQDTVTVTIADPLTLPVDFDDANRDYNITGFGGAEGSIVENPDRGDGNGSANVLQLFKSDGSEVWAGVVFDLGETIDFAGGELITVDVWSPRAGVPVLFKVEDQNDANTFIEVTATTTTAESWETLTFDLAAGDLSQRYGRVALFADFGTNGMGETFYFDGIAQTDGQGTIGFPLTFEEGNIEFSFVTFGGASAEVVDNPDVTDANPSSRVVRASKMDGSEVWGGAFVDADAVLDFSATQRVSVKVWSPTAGANILLKFENPANPDINQEVQVTTTTSGEWEELTFDFSGIEELSGIQRIVFFPNFGVSGTEGDYYFDDFRLIP